MTEPSIRHLRAFVVVAKLGGISAAAASLGRSQPAITRAIKLLEQTFEVDLFKRSKMGVFLTEPGQTLLSRAKTSLDLVYSAAEEVSAFDKKAASRAAHNISTTQLKALIAVSEHGSFAAAAAAEGRAVPSLHRAARELESLVGVALFEKTSFGVKPTREALTLSIAADKAFAELRHARADLAYLRGHEKGETVIGAMPFARAFLAPMAATEFSQDNVGHRISIVEAPYETLLRDLRRGRIDFLIGATRGDQKASDVVEEAVFEDTLSILMRPGHPLAGMRRLTAKKLAALPWVAPRQSSPLRSHFEGLFAGYPLPVDIVECNSLVSARVMLMNSERLMLLSDAQAQLELKSGAIISRKPPGANLSRTICLSFRRDWRPTRAQTRLINILRRIASEL